MHVRRSPHFVLQVLDMLLAAGMSVSNPLLATLFRIRYVGEEAFHVLEKAFHPDAKPRPSRKLLLEIAAWGSNFSSWSKKPHCARHIQNVHLLGRSAVSTSSLALNCQGEILFHLRGYTFRLDVALACNDDSTSNDGKQQVSTVHH